MTARSDGVCGQHARMIRGQGPRQPDMAAEERQRRALALVVAGATYEQVARTVGYNDRSAARQAALTALGKIAPVDEVEQWRALQAARYERMILAAWPDAIGDGRPVDLSAQHQVRRHLEAQARLLGLNAPAETKLVGDDGGPVKIELSIAEQRQIVEATAARLRPRVLEKIEQATRGTG